MNNVQTATALDGYRSLGQLLRNNKSMFCYTMQFNGFLFCCRSPPLALSSVRADGDVKWKRKSEHAGARLIVLHTETEWKRGLRQVSRKS